MIHEHVSLCNESVPSVHSSSIKHREAQRTWDLLALSALLHTIQGSTKTASGAVEIHRVQGAIFSILTLKKNKKTKKNVGAEMCSYIDQRPLWEYLQTNKRLLSQWKWSSVCLDLCVLSSLTTQSSATSCIRRQTSVQTLFQSHNFVETKVIHLHIDPQIMYFILSCFLFMFLHIYDIFI